MNCKEDKETLHHVGKQFYMAPEIACPPLQAKLSHYDPRTSDMYSLGICLFMLAFGFQPYNTPSAQDHRFVALAQHGVKFLLQRYRLLESADRKVLTLLENLLVPAHSRWDISQVSDYISTQKL